MFVHDDQGRAKAAKQIRKAHRPEEAEVDRRFLKTVSHISLFSIVRDHQQKMQKRDNGPTFEQRRILKAVRPNNLRMQSNGVPQSLKLFKIAHEQPIELDGDFLPRLKKITLPRGSSNGMSDDNRAADGAVLAHDGVNDESTDMRTKPTVVGSQAVTSVSAANDPRVIAAIKSCMLNPRPLMP